MRKSTFGLALSLLVTLRGLDCKAISRELRMPRSLRFRNGNTTLLKRFSLTQKINPTLPSRV